MVVKVFVSADVPYMAQLFGVEFDEGIPSGELYTRSVGMFAIFLLDPSVHELGAEGEAAIGIPDDVAGGITALVICIPWRKFRSRNLQPSKGRAGSNGSCPVVLIANPRSKGGQHFQAQIRRRPRLRIQAQAEPIAGIACDSVAVSYLPINRVSSHDTPGTR